MNVMKNYAWKFGRRTLRFWVHPRSWMFGVTRFTSTLTPLRAIYDVGPFSLVIRERP